MEEAQLKGPAGVGVRRGGVLLLAAGLGIGATGIGYAVGGARVAAGAVAGALVAAGYSWSFLHSHLAKSARGTRFDSVLAGGAMARLVVAGLAGYAMWMVGRSAAMAYLLAFGGCFALLAAPQVVRLSRQIRAAKPAHEPGGEAV